MTNLVCLIFGHRWSMYRGFEQIHPHHTSFCLRCEVPYVETKPGRAEHG